MPTSAAAQNSTIRVSIGIARFGVRPVVLIPTFRSLGRYLWNISTISGRSFRVVGSPPERFAISIFCQSGSWKQRSISSIFMSDLRSPHFQLLHIVQRASQTHVQL